MRARDLLWWTLLVSCQDPTATWRGEPRAAPQTPPPCDRLKARQEAGRRSFRRCTWTDDGAVGVVADPDPSTFRIVFEPTVGPAVVSPPLASMNAQVEDVRILPPIPGATIPVTFAKYRDRIQPGPLGAPLAVQTREFFASIFDAEKPLGSCVWTGLEEITAKRYQLTFRLPELRWTRGLAYGGRADEALPGVEAEVLLDGRYQLESARDLSAAVAAACRVEPALEWANVERLWAAAQCHRVRGEPIAAVLARVEARCRGLARQALPPLRTMANLRARERDGLSVEPRDMALASEQLGASNPPSACFAADPLWNVDYTARSRPFEMPKVFLEPAWSEGLEALGQWPR